MKLVFLQNPLLGNNFKQVVKEIEKFLFQVRNIEPNSRDPFDQFVVYPNITIPFLRSEIWTCFMFNIAITTTFCIFVFVTFFFFNLKDLQYFLQCDCYLTFWFVFLSAINGISIMPKIVVLKKLKQIEENQSNTTDLSRYNLCFCRSSVERLSGLSDQEFDRLSTITLKEDFLNEFNGQDCCSICCENFEKNQKTLLLKCPGSHIYHLKCIQRWLYTKKTCPNCNVPAISLNK